MTTGGKCKLAIFAPCICHMSHMSQMSHMSHMRVYFVIGVNVVVPLILYVMMKLAIVKPARTGGRDS